MAYPPSSTISYFNQIYFISNLNDWLIVDGVFFVIRSIILLSNKTEKNETCGIPIVSFEVLFSRTKPVQSYSIVDPSEMTTPKMQRYRNDTGLDVHATYIEFC